MAEADAQTVRAQSQTYSGQGTINSPGIFGYAKLLSHPAYERFLLFESLLRKMVPVLIVIFLAIVAVARWVSLSNQADAIRYSASAELNFIAEIIT